MFDRLWKKVILIFSVGFLLLSNINVLAKSDLINFDDNIKLLDKKFTVEVAESFIQNDRNIIKSYNNKDRINNELYILKNKLADVKNEAISVRGIKIYSANSSLKNNAIRIGIKNRENLLKSLPMLDQRKGLIYNIDGLSDNCSNYISSFSQKEMDINLDATKKVIENIDLDLDFLKNTKFVISPYKIEGVNGYTLTKSSGKSTVVIANHLVGAPEEWIKRTTMSTVLHEIGHVFDNSHSNLSKKNTNLKYVIETDSKLSKASAANDVEKWQTSKSENFAEDFRSYFSSRLGNESFQALEKKTILPYNENLFKTLINSFI